VSHRHDPFHVQAPPHDEHVDALFAAALRFEAEQVTRLLKRLHYPLDVILLCVRWYVAYPLSLRHLEQMSG
jgi:hypothetical protein